jgi:hypothetical protein
MRDTELISYVSASCALCVFHTDASRLGSQVISSISIRVAVNTLSPTYSGRLLLSGGQQADMKPFSHSFTSCFPGRHQETLYKHTKLHKMVSLGVYYALQNTLTLSTLKSQCPVRHTAYTASIPVRRANVYVQTTVSIGQE